MYCLADKLSLKDNKVHRSVLKRDRLLHVQMKLQVFKLYDPTSKLNFLPFFNLGCGVDAVLEKAVLGLLHFYEMSQRCRPHHCIPYGL